MIFFLVGFFGGFFIANPGGISVGRAKFSGGEFGPDRHLGRFAGQLEREKAPGRAEQCDGVEYAGAEADIFAVHSSQHQG